MHTYQKILASMMVGMTIVPPLFGVAENIKAYDNNQSNSETRFYESLPREVKDNSEDINLQDKGEVIVVATEEVNVEIPRNDTKPVIIKSDDAEIAISLPKVNRLTDVQEISGDMIHFESEDSFSNLVQPTPDGVRFMAVIADSSAPTEYRYDISIEGSYRLVEAINVAGERGVMILDETQEEILAIVNPAWAKDVEGKSIPTWFEIRDNDLIQHVDHRSVEAVYPIIADPYVENFWWGTKIWLKRAETYQYIRHMDVGSFAALFYNPGLGSLLYANKWWAEGVYDRGKCIGITSYFSGPIWMWEWKNQHCY